MTTKYLLGLFSLFVVSPVEAGEWNFNASGRVSALYGYSDVDSHYKKFHNNHHLPSEAEINLSAEYIFNDRAYTAGFYLDTMLGIDKELADYTQGKWGEEAYAILDTPYGRIMGGQTWNVAYQFGVGAPSVGPLGVNNSDIVDFITNPNWQRNKSGTAFRTLNSTDINTDGTALKISYITPEFYQTVIGLTYVPNIYSRAGLVSRYADYKNEDGYIAALYNHAEFKGFNLETSLGLGLFADNDREISFGMSLSHGNWMFGGSYRRTYVEGHDYPQNLRYKLQNIPEYFDAYREGYAWNLGISYAFGPYQAGLSYFNSKADHIDNEDRIIQFSNQYQLNKYTDLYLIAAHVDYRGADNDTCSDTKGYAFITGVGFNF